MRRNCYMMDIKQEKTFVVESIVMHINLIRPNELLYNPKRGCSNMFDGRLLRKDHHTHFFHVFLSMK